jgi:ubiquinone biosynthesis protein UbiJ
MTIGPQLPLARELAALLERTLNGEIAESTPARDLVADLDGESFAIDVRGLGARVVLQASDGRVGVDLRWQAAAQSRSRDTPEVHPWGSVRTSLCSQGLGNDSGRPPAPHVAPRSAGDSARPPASARPFDSAPASAQVSGADSTPPRAASATLSATPIDLLRLARSSDLSTLRGTGAEISGSPEVAERFAKLLKLARPDLEEHAARWLGDVPAHALGEAARGVGAWLDRAARALRANTAEYLQEESRALPAALEAQAFYADVERLRDDVERAAARLARLERR